MIYLCCCYCLLLHLLSTQLVIVRQCLEIPLSGLLVGECIGMLTITWKKLGFKIRNHSERTNLIGAGLFSWDILWKHSDLYLVAMQFHIFKLYLLSSKVRIVWWKLSNPLLLMHCFCIIHFLYGDVLTTTMLSRSLLYAKFS